MNRHYLPEEAPSYPPGLVYVGRWSRNVYRMREKGERTVVLHRQLPPGSYLDGRAKHRQRDPYNEAAMWRIFCGPGAGGWEFRR